MSALRVFSSVLLYVVCVTAYAEDVQFNRDIRPILSSNCFQCHGPDEHERKADLRLDEEEGIRIVFGSGDLDESEAWHRINSSDPDLQMPPPDSHREMKPEQIELVKIWIESGAKWEGHWAFIAPRKPEIPKPNETTRTRNPIDAFIAEEAKQNGLVLSPRASRESLIRRVTFDLTGLPPTLSEIDDFLNDVDEKAFERVVDRLLDSPHFGERMALVWMDMGRYGDTSVFHADGPRDMWPWRDWVIRAFNENLPYDQFTVEQLAGDLLPNPTNEQLIASGFNRNNATTDEGGAIAEEFRVEYAVDRVATTSLVWMGLSMQCAQCHDHKYDPITQEEYYQFFAYFNQASDPGMQTRNGNQSPTTNVFDSKNLSRADKLQPELDSLTRKKQEAFEAADPGFRQWLENDAAAELKASKISHDDIILSLPLDQIEKEQIVDSGGNRIGKINGKLKLVQGKFGKAIHIDKKNYVDLGDVGNFERTDSFSYGGWIRPAKKASGTVIAKMDEASGSRGFDLLVQANRRVEVHIINKWPDNAIKVYAEPKLKPETWHHVFATYDGSSKAAGVKIYVNGKLQETKTEQDKLNDTIRTKTPLYLGRRNPGQPFHGEVDDVLIYKRELSADEIAKLANEKPAVRLLAISADDRTEEQTAELKTHYALTHNKTYSRLTKEHDSLKTEIENLRKPISTVMVMKDVDSPRMTYVLNRGNYDSPLKDRPVEPRTPSVLPSLNSDTPKNRLGMAKWLVDPKHPLTARVAVNRYWYMLFGKGIVRTVEEFGSQGAWPTHPALLDWLAVDFVESGWNVKRMIKQMVMSNTYCQSSKVEPVSLKKDPENLLLTRGPRFRLPGEFIRDNALSASGLLVKTIGGPSVKPYQPAGLWNEVSINTGLRFKQDHGDKVYRRSLYTYWKRSAPAPSLAIFDTPSREKCVVQRSRTNTPLQALVTLNDIQFVEASRALAERAILVGGSKRDEWIQHAFRLATGTRPSEKTMNSLRMAFDEELSTFKQNPKRADELLKIGESERHQAIDSATHAAMTIVASIILNLDQTVTRG